MWAYEKGHDDIVSLLKRYPRACLQEDYARGEYCSGGDSSYFPLPSPIGKIRIITQGLNHIFNVLKEVALNITYKVDSA